MKFEKNNVVQINAQGVLDKALHGCIGLIVEMNDGIAKVAIYHPQEKGKNPFIQKFDIPIGNLVFIGEPKFKPF